MGKKLLLLGDSITFQGRYAAMIETFLKYKNIDVTFYNLGVSSENTSGLTEAGHPFPRPNILRRVDRILDAIAPDVVVCLYGVNDGIYYPASEEITAGFQNGISELYRRIKARGATTVFCTPVFFDAKSVQSAMGDTLAECEQCKLYRNYDTVMTSFADYVKLNIPADRIADVHTAMQAFVREKRQSNPKFRSGDGIHPFLEGNQVIAETILKEGFDLDADFSVLFRSKAFCKLYRMVFRKAQQELFYNIELFGHENIYKCKPMPKEKLDAYLLKCNEKIAKQQKKAVRLRYRRWQGFRRAEFNVGGKKASVILPEALKAGVNFVWKPEFLDAYTEVDQEFLRRGYALIYLHMPDLYGSEQGLRLMRQMYRAARSIFPLSQKFGFIGLSRGGLSAVRYAGIYPDDVAGIYLDAPVVDAESWPGGKGVGIGSPEDVKKLSAVYGIDCKDLSVVKQKMLTAAETVAEKNIPVLLISNADDDVVPFAENGALLAEKLPAATCKVIIKQASGHHPHGLGDGAEICDWLEDRWK